MRLPRLINKARQLVVRNKTKSPRLYRNSHGDKKGEQIKPTLSE